MIARKINLLVLAILALPFIGLAQNEKYMQKNIGIQLYSLRDYFDKDVASTLKTISDWGITIIEGGENTYGVPQKEFIGLLKANGLKTVSVGTNVDELRDAPEKAIARAKAFGATYAMCPWIPHEGDFTIEDAKKAIAIFNESGKLLRANGVNLVYHPHGYEFRPYKKGTLFDYMAKNAEYFDFEMDVYWVIHGGEKPEKLFEKYPDKFKLMHLKDMAEGTVGDYTGHSDVEMNVTLGKGIIDISGLAKMGMESGVEYMFLEDESSKVIDQVPQSLEYLKKI